MNVIYKKGYIYVMRKLDIIYENKKIVIISIIVIMYFIGAIFFNNHYLINTYINGINVSFESTNKAELKITNEFNNYELQLNGRNGMQESIIGKDIELSCTCRDEEFKEAQKKQNNFLWITSIFHNNDISIENLVNYDEEKLINIIDNLQCIKGDNIVEPMNPSFKYDGSKYQIYDEVYGNKIDKNIINETIKKSINAGIKKIDLDKENCYENPKYTSKSEKVLETKNILDKYVSSKIVYDFDEETETIDGELINKWLIVNDDLDVEFNNNDIKQYIDNLCDKYNTVGKERDFKTSTGKIIKIKGGYYGWKIKTEEETKDLIENIKKGQNIMKEPIYSQKAMSRNENDIGDTYVEVNITRQCLWFYKNGKLITQGDVVTGNINRGCATQLGIYPLNYKQKNATLKGFGYSSPVQYWMPFNGNIGIHDASWRNSFGGDIYKSNGTHGCVNAPLYLAKAIYEEIDSGIPIICYEEK